MRRPGVHRKVRATPVPGDWSPLPDRAGLANIHRIVIRLTRVYVAATTRDSGKAELRRSEPRVGGRRTSDAPPSSR